MWKSTCALLRAGLLFLGLAFAWHAHAAYNQSLNRTLDSGPIYGKSDANNTQAFLGIPYAKPPVGSLRWRAPQPPTPWTASRAATTLAPMCIQIGSFFGEPDPATFGQPVGSEDCLYVNVWRPNSTADNLPVFLWIHGGSNVKGSIREPLYNGAYLASKANMVVVTVQYRLGMLGFLNHPAIKTGEAKDDSGNYTTLDLVRALDWVRANAQAFGGDANSVTIAGQSAGCINTWGLLQSPLANGKFQRAWCMSGVPNGYPPAVGTIAANSMIDNLIVDNGSASTTTQAAAQHALMSSSQIRSLLYSASAAQIMKLTPSPIVPGHFTDGTVIRAGGLVDVVAGVYNRVPLVIGTTRDEGSYFAYSFGMGKPTPQQFWQLANYAAPGTVTFGDLIKPEWQALYQPTHRVITGALDLTIDNMLRLMRVTSGPNMLYRYNFNWDDTPAPWNTTFGAFHGIDIALLFGNYVTADPNFMHFAWDSANAAQRKALSDRMIRHLSNFVRTGAPSKLFDGQVYWQDWTNYTCDICGYVKRMVFDNTSYMSGDEYLMFWTKYWELNPAQRDYVWKTVDFNALPANVDPFRDGTH